MIHKEINNFGNQGSSVETWSCHEPVSLFLDLMLAQAIIPDSWGSILAHVYILFSGFIETRIAKSLFFRKSYNQRIEQETYRLVQKSSNWFYSTDILFLNLFLILLQLKATICPDILLDFYFYLDVYY